VKAVTRFFPWAKPHKEKGKTWDEVAADFNKILPAGHPQLVGTHSKKQIEPDNIVFFETKIGTTQGIRVVAVVEWRLGPMKGRISWSCYIVGFLLPQ
jgi:hypothetical protein